MKPSRNSNLIDTRNFHQWTLVAQSTTVLIWLVIIVSVLLMLATGYIASQALTNAKSEELRQSSHLEALHMAAELDREAATLEAFAASSTVQNSLQEQTSDIATVVDAFRQQSPDTEAVALISTSGEVIARSLATEDSPAIDQSKWEWFDNAQQEIFVAEEIKDGLTGVKGIHFALPIRNTETSELLGVLYTVINPNRFTQPILQETDMVLAVIRPSGILVMASDRTRTILPPYIRQDIIDSPSGILISRMAYGYTTLADLGLASSLANQLDWVVIIQRPASQVVSETRLVVLFLELLIGASAAVLCGGILLVRRPLFTPLIALANTGKQLVETNNLEISIPDPNSQDLKAISTAFKVLIERLKHRSIQFETAASISREVVSQDIDILLSRTAQMIHEQLGYPTVYIYQLNRDGLRADVKALASTSKRVGLEPGNAIILNDRSYIGRALLQNETQFHEGTASSFAAKLDTPSEIVIPFQEAAPGALHVIGDGPHTLGQPDLDILHLLANEIGAILENHILFEEVEIAKTVAEAAKAEAEQANLVKSQFLASMSHELRTPLNAILNFSKFVSSGMLGPVNDEQEDVLDKISTSGKHLLNLINDVLDISKIESGSLRLFIEDGIDLNAEIDTVIASARALLSNKPVEVKTNIDPELPHILGDKRRIRQIMLNLISNACKFTDNGSITIEMHKNDGEVQFAVQDTGIGIAPEDSEAIFEAFRQTEEGLKQGEGTGLGLPIARRLSEAHGGRLWFESEIGRGTTFHMALPIHSEELAATLEKETYHAN